MSINEVYQNISTQEILSEILNNLSDLNSDKNSEGKHMLPKELSKYSSRISTAYSLTKLLQERLTMSELYTSSINTAVIDVDYKSVEKNRKLICCFTGHRPQHLSFGFNEGHKDCIKVKEMLFEQILRAIKLGYRYFISGMALGVDTWAVELLLNLKNKYPDIIIEGAIPCKDQECKWILESKERYRKLLKKLDVITYVSDSNYASGCMEKRDDYMIEKSSLLIAVYMDKNGGTKHTFDQGIKKGMTIFRINPMNFTINNYNVKE